MLAYFGGISLHGRALFGQISSDRIAEVRVDDEVRGPGERGLKAAADLVLPLSAGLEMLKTVLDTIFDALVIAGLEVQAIEVGRRTPVTPVQRVARLEKNGRGHGLPAIAGDLEHQGIAQSTGDLAEELTIEVRLV